MKHHAMSLVGEPKYVSPTSSISTGSIRTRPRAARVRQFAEGSFDSLNPFSIKGQAAERHCRSSTASSSRTARTSVPPSTAYVCEWVSYPADYSLRDVRPARRRTLPRRQADHARRRRLLARSAEEGVAALCRLLQGRLEGRSDGCGRGDVPLCRPEQSRTADDHRPAAYPAEALLGGQGRQRRAARPHEVVAGSRRSAPVPTK